MNLMCPHCQKIVSVSDELAGQITNCSLCGGTFMVPRVETPPPSPPSLSQPEPDPPAPVPSAPTTHLAPSPPTPTTTAVEPATTLRTAPVDGLANGLRIRINPKVVQWIAPACFVLIFLIFCLPLFPWVGLYAGDVTIVRQFGAGIAFGSYSSGTLEAFPFQEVFKKDDKVPAAVLMIFYFILFLLGTLGVIALYALPSFRPELAEQILPWRPFGLTAVSLLAFIFLLLQMLFGFPLERLVNKRIGSSTREASTMPRRSSPGRNARPSSCRRTSRAACKAIC
jgi:hypothetical protein